MLRIMGTPAEEGGGGKIEMARRGAFEHVGAAMMVHPADADLISMDTIALQELHVQFHGKAAHAAAAPWEGRNALDAAVLGYINIAAMRQHIRPTERIHGVFTKGGDKANIVPGRDGDGVDRAVGDHRVAAAAQAAGADVVGERRDGLRVHDRPRMARRTRTPT